MPKGGRLDTPVASCLVQGDEFAGDSSIRRLSRREFEARSEDWRRTA